MIILKCCTSATVIDGTLKEMSRSKEKSRKYG